VSIAPPARAPIVPVRITDPGDPRLSDYAALRDPALRRDGLFLVESRLAVEQLLVGARHRVRSLLATDAALPSLGDALAATTPAPSVYVADAAIVRHVAGYPFHRGCLATAERGPEASLDTILRALPRGPGTLLALDGVANPDNVGGLFRTAAAFGAAAVLLSPGSADPLYRKAIRAGMGASRRGPALFTSFDGRDGRSWRSCRTARTSIASRRRPTAASHSSPAPRATACRRRRARSAMRPSASRCGRTWTR
jgi:hypothetical protein